MNLKKNDDASEHPLDLIVRLLRWPEKRGNGLVPWYVIAWRAMFMPLVYGGLAVAWIGVALANGPRQAARFWRNAT